MVEKLKIGAIIQARLGSTRLPNKVLLPLPFNGELSILEQVLLRADKSNKFNTIIVATSDNTTDNVLADFLQRKHTAFFRGSEEDVLSRFYEAATEHELDVIVRLTADNPCLDPNTIADTIDQHILLKNDYTRTTGLPIGMNIEVMSYQALKTAFEEAKDKHDREHVTSYLYANPEKFKIHFQPYSFENEAFSNFRLTVDYPSDYAMVNLIFDNFGSENTFSMDELYLFWKQNLWLEDINKSNFQKRIYADPKEELSDAVKILKFYNFETAADLLTSEIEK